ncbi:acyl-CoA dehydrogenase family protein, partial [Leucobacter albus]
MTSEIDQFRAMVRSVVDTEITPHIERWEAEGTFPAHELFPKLAAHGLLGLSFAQEDGGEGAPLEYQMVLSEELGRGNAAGIAMAVNVQMHMATPSLAQFGSAELKQRYLGPAIRGEHVAAIAVTEPDA